MQRGNLEELTPSTIDNYRHIVHEEINVKALRLAPYVLYKAMDHAPLQREHLDEEEKEIIKNWHNMGLLICYPFNQPVVFLSDLVGDKFYKLITDMVYEAYILKSEEDIYE